MPGTFPTRLTTMRRRLFPVRTFTALLIVMLSRLIPFTSTSLSPTHNPANSVAYLQNHRTLWNRLKSKTTSTLFAMFIIVID
uniref:Uncharacterized protein n=1 Tax=Pygocentrus nattereri TaxID=42514 RepID=A0A3B4CLP3_PYGNA